MLGNWDTGFGPVTAKAWTSLAASCEGADVLQPSVLIALSAHVVDGFPIFKMVFLIVADR